MPWQEERKWDKENNRALWVLAVCWKSWSTTGEEQGVLISVQSTGSAKSIWQVWKEKRFSFLPMAKDDNNKKKVRKNKRGIEKMPDGDLESQCAYEDIRGSVWGSFKASLQYLA